MSEEQKQVLPTIELPKYEITLPISKKKISYRPFVVREEKILLIALEEGKNEQISTALKHVLNSCTYGKLNIDDLSKTDIEYLFVHVRNKSMGEGVEAISTCVHCEKKNYMTLDMSKVEVVMPKKTIHDTIQISQNVWIKMRLPNIDTSYDFEGANGFDEIIRVTAKCIVHIINGDSIIKPASFSEDQLSSWLEGLSEDTVIKIGEFLTNVPMLKFEQQYDCVHCRQPNLILLEGLESFFG